MSAPLSHFGLVGSFDGDREKLDAIHQLRTQLVAGQTVTTEQVRAVLALMPFSGRIEFCAKCLINQEMTKAVQDKNGHLVMNLFRECFDAIGNASSTGATNKTVQGSGHVNSKQVISQDQDDDEFVIISLCSDSKSGSSSSSEVKPSSGAAASELLYLKSSHYFVLHSLIAALQSYGSISANLFDIYTNQTTSTVFRQQFIKSMVAAPQAIFSDERLEKVYQSSVEAMRRLIEAECKTLKDSTRATFITRLINSGATSAVKELIHHATAQKLEQHFLASVQVVAEPTSTGKILITNDADWSWELNWPLHGDVYQRFLSTHLASHASDPIWCGRFLYEFISLLGTARRLPMNVASTILALYQKYRPLNIQSQVPPAVKEYLLALSKKAQLNSNSSEAGKEPEILYEGLERAVPNALILRNVPADERWQLLKSLLVRTPDGLAFSSSVVPLCQTILNDLSKKRSNDQVLTTFTVELLQALSQREFLRLVFKNASGTDSPVGSTLRSFLGVAFECPHFRFLQPVLDAWMELHLKNTPKIALTEPEYSKRTEEALWRSWIQSVSGVFIGRITSVAAKANTVLKGSSIRMARTPITSYVGYMGILADALFVGFEQCANHLPPTEFVSLILTAVDQLTPLLSQTAVAPLYPPIVAGTKPSVPMTGVDVISNVRKIGEKFILLTVSALQRALTFDLTSAKYAQVSTNEIMPLLTRISSQANLVQFPSLADALFGFYKGTLEAVKIPEAIQKQGFVMVPPAASSSAVTDVEQNKSKKIRWVFINTNYHQQCTQMIMDKLISLCLSSKTIPALERLAPEAWKLVRSRYFTNVELKDADALKQINTLTTFLSVVATMPSSITIMEKPLLRTALVHHLTMNTFHDQTIGTGMDGWWSFLLGAVDACGAEWPSRNSWLVRIADVSLPPVRQAMEAATHDREPTNRQQAYLQLLRVSSTPITNNYAAMLKEFAATVELVQRRTKNEAGLYRQDIYYTIASNMPGMVTRSLDSKINEQESLASVQIMTDALIQILKDDVSKRDSVAKGVFRNLGHQLLKSAISQVSSPLLSVRRAWMMCGITLDTILMRVNGGGEDGSSKYIWPLSGVVFSSEYSISEGALMGKIQTAMVSGMKGGEHAFANLRHKVYSENRHISVAPNELYTIEQAVDLLTSTLFTLRQQSDDKVTGPNGQSVVRTWDYLVDGAFFPAAGDEGDVTSAAAADANPSVALSYQSNTLKCFQQLLSFCGTAWTSVPKLVRFFDTLINTIATPSNASHRLFDAHYNQTYGLFNTIRQLYTDGAAWYELPSLARAATVLFESAIRRSSVSVSQSLRPVWTLMQMHRGKITTLGSLDLVELGFLVANVKLVGRHALGGINPPVKSKVELLAIDKADTTERAAKVLRDLLKLSVSSLHQTWSQLALLRDDIFSGYLGRTREELYGVFDPAAPPTLTPLSSKLASETVWFPIKSDQLVAMNATAMATFTRMCMERAMNQALPPAVRSAAITQFVESPTASHLDVIGLLKKLQAIIAVREAKEKEKKESKEKKEEEKKTEVVADASADAPGDDDAADLLLESVILRVFQTDGVWFILAYLLSPDIIASAPQRTTATILTRLALWCSVDRTAAVVRVLLEPRRRWAIGFFLHKQILRLLFECSDHSQLARDLFMTEWNQRNSSETKMSTDVRFEMVKMSVGVLNDTNPSKQALAWKIVEDLVHDGETQEIDSATIALLFTPYWQPTSTALACPRLDEQAQSLAYLLRSAAPERVITAGVVAVSSFGYFHSQVLSEPISSFKVNNRQMCEKMVKLMQQLSVSSKNPYVKAFSQLEQFLFSPSMEGVRDDTAMERLHRLLIQATIESVDPNPVPAAATTTLGLSSSSSGWMGGLDVKLDDTTSWTLLALPRLFAGLTMQVLTRALMTDYPASERPYQACVKVCASHPYAIRLRECIGTLLLSLLNTPPSNGSRRLRVTKVVVELMNRVMETQLPTSTTAVGKATSWSSQLFQTPFGPLLNFLRADSQRYSSLPAGIIQDQLGSQVAVSQQPALVSQVSYEKGDELGLSLFD